MTIASSQVSSRTSRSALGIQPRKLAHDHIAAACQGRARTATSKNLAAHCRHTRPSKRRCISVAAERGPVPVIGAHASVDQDEQQSTEIPTRLNDVPHNRDKRQWFYDEVSTAVLAALADGVTRMKVRCTIPELNPEMDVYRIGTLLEMVREIAYVLAQDGKRVKVCVQQSMGQGVFQGLPLSLSGVKKIMNMMDWGDIGQFVSFGEVGADQIDSANYYILVAPQNVVGTTILTNLGEMVDEAEAQGKALILVNPVLKDIPSAAGVMGVRGRAERLAFADSFDEAYHFRLLYMARALMYPIMGAMRHRHGQQWQVWRRHDLGKKKEKYELVESFPTEPRAKALTEAFQDKPKAVDTSKPFWASL